MKNQLFVLSDIHLESKSDRAHTFILEQINSLIDKNRAQGIEPTIVFAGDIHNGIKGYPFMEKVNAEIIYLCGNHEFWKCDYEQTLIELKNHAPKNVKFLHNDIVELSEHIVMGATMWTDIGLSFNPDLFSHAANVMNDNHEIKYATWYENTNNIDSLQSLYSSDEIETMIHNKSWNIIIEAQENQKSINFFNSVGKVLTLLKKIPSQLDILSSKLNSSYEPITKEQYRIKKSILESYKENSLHDWLNECVKNGMFLYDNVANSFLHNNILKESEEIAFNKLKNMNIQKPLVVASHHMPFIEERLLGQQQWIRNKPKLYNNNLKEDIYNIHFGTNYKDDNYFFNISKGRYDREDSILAVIHYSNNGSKNFTASLMDNVSCWLHGHEHHYNYQDYLKNIPIVTNPLGYSMAVFSFKDGEIKLGHAYKSYHNVSDEDEYKEISDIVSSFLRPVNNDVSNQNDKINTVKLWCLKNFDIEGYLEKYKNLKVLNKKLLTYLVKKSDLIVRDFTTKEKQEVTFLISAINYHLLKIEESQKELQNAVALRLDKNYSFMNKSQNMINDFSIVHDLERGITDRNSMYNKLKPIDFNIVDWKFDEDMGFSPYETLVQTVFINVYCANKIVTNISQLKSKLEEVENSFIQHVSTKKAQELFTYKNEYEDFMAERTIENELHTKQKQLIEKYMTVETKKLVEQKNNRMKDKFNF